MEARSFYRYHEIDIVENALSLSEGDVRQLRRYYHRIVESRASSAFHAYNWTRRTEPMARLIARLPRREKTWRILDAGCGTGTEAIYWATLRGDVEVVGVDLSPDLVRVAEARRAGWEARIGRDLPLAFLCDDVFVAMEGRAFDVVWSMESISHIDPAEGFVELAARTLPEGGHLVISDTHALNPAMAWRVHRLRQRGVPEHGQRSLPDGATVQVAQERLLSVPYLTRVLRRAGLRLVTVQLSVFFPPRFTFCGRLFAAVMRAERVLTHVPLLRQLGAIYTVVAQKSLT